MMVKVLNPFCDEHGHPHENPWQTTIGDVPHTPWCSHLFFQSCLAHKKQSGFFFALSQRCWMLSAAGMSSMRQFSREASTSTNNSYLSNELTFCLISSAHSSSRSSGWCLNQALQNLRPCSAKPERERKKALCWCIGTGRCSSRRLESARKTT